MQFEVRALSPENRIIALVVDAQDEAGARAHVDARGLHVTRVAPARA
ncbi:type II secretion system F family protein, partial [Burkholderia sp. Cy-647]|nr:type II secretion system F family protein [Burkholderia sp. Cy-647]